MTEPQCNGICLWPSDVGVPVVSTRPAYPHPDCPAHGNGDATVPEEYLGVPIPDGMKPNWNETYGRPEITWWKAGARAAASSLRAQLAEARKQHDDLIERLCALIPDDEGDDVAAEALIVEWVKRQRTGRSILDAAWVSVWLHGRWQWLTKNMTTDEREAAADAVDRGRAALEPDEPPEPIERWWRDPAGVGEKPGQPVAPEEAQSNG